MNGRRGEEGESSRQRETTTSGSAKSGGKRGTPEQEKLIAKIKKAGADYYEVLGVAKGSSEADIKKAIETGANCTRINVKRTAPRRCSRR